MKKTNIFDVLIVYDAKIANGEMAPFSLVGKRKKYNDVYSFFLKECKKMGIRAAFTTTNDIINSGTCKSYWVYQNNSWIHRDKTCYSMLIFDKFSVRNSRLQQASELLFSSFLVKPYKDTMLSKLFNDKQQTHDALHEYSIPTVSFNSSSRKEINRSLQALKALLSEHKHANDFMKDIVLKDKFGAGGNNIFKISGDYTNEIYKKMQELKDLSFVVQPCMNFEKGYSYKDNVNATEIRYIYLQNKIVQMYIRIAGNANFLCNNGSGGIEVGLYDIPTGVTLASQKISKLLDRKESLYALDFIVSNNKNVYLLEGNISPGIDWNPENIPNVLMNQRMIKIIVADLKNKIYSRERNIFSNVIAKLSSARLLSQQPVNAILLGHQNGAF